VGTYIKRGIKAVKTGYQKYVSGTKGPHSLKGVTDSYMKSKLTRMNVQANKAVQAVRSSGTTPKFTSYTTKPNFKFMESVSSRGTMGTNVRVDTYQNIAKGSEGTIKQLRYTDQGIRGGKVNKLFPADQKIVKGMGL
jgi:hypothetical protein